MRKLLLFLVVIIDLKASSQSQEVHRIDSLVYTIQNQTKSYIIDSGIVELVHHKRYAKFYDLYHPDSLNKLIEVSHEQDTGNLRDLIIFSYYNDELIKVDYSLFLLDENGAGELDKRSHYFKDGVCIYTDYIMSHSFKEFKFLSPERLFEMGTLFQKKYKLRFR